MDTHKTKIWRIYMYSVSTALWRVDTSELHVGRPVTITELTAP